MMTEVDFDNDQELTEDEILEKIRRGRNEAGYWTEQLRKRKFFERVEEERKLQIERGYTAEHDAAEGVLGLLDIAQHYTRKAEEDNRSDHFVEIAALIEAAKDVYVAQRHAELRGEGKPETALTFHQEIAALINRHSKENGSDTPDFILAQFLNDGLEAFDRAVVNREKWYGHDGMSYSG